MGGCRKAPSRWLGAFWLPEKLPCHLKIPLGYMENKIKKCPHCQTEVDLKATRCAHCQSDMRNWPRRHPVVTAFIAIVFVFIMFDSGSSSTSSMNSLYSKVATDAVAQYEIAARQGDKIQICVQAGLVSAAFLQAKDEANYQAWKATEKNACTRAGMPQF